MKLKSSHDEPDEIYNPKKYFNRIQKRSQSMSIPWGKWSISQRYPFHPQDKQSIQILN